MTPSRLVRTGARALHGCGLIRALSRAAGYARRAPAFPILTYHRVNDDRDPFFPAVPTEVFDRHMDFVARTYRVLTVEECVERMRVHTLPRNALALTFDDGYRDNLTHAAPILARHGLPATIFLATGFIGTAEVPWFDRVAMAMKLTSAQSFVAPSGERMGLAGEADRSRALKRTLATLKRRPDDDLRRAVDRLLEDLGVTDQRSFKNWMLSWDDVHALAGLGFSIGAHTVNHPILSRVGRRRARTEIVGSRTMIESACGRAPAAFAYPNGASDDYTAAVIRLVRDAGFRYAVTTRFGINTSATSPWELRRGGPWEHDVSIFALKLAWYRTLGACAETRPRATGRGADR
jgi:peptidoglycan/xylan/chitin deacetylase (PgdA/CDA1 family)